MRDRVLGIVLALSVGGLPLAPPEHVHEAEALGHEHLIVHRHVAAHSHQHHQDDHRAVFDDDDARIVALDSILAGPSSTMVARTRPTAPIELVEPPAARFVSARSADVERLIHGPPRAPNGLRAPPLDSRL